MVQHLCVHDSGTAPVGDVQWCSTCVCCTVEQHLWVLYSGTAPVCAVQWYSTCACCTVVQHMCVLYSGTALVCAVVVQHFCVLWYSTYVCSSGTAHVCAVQWYRTFVFSTVVQCCDTPADANATNHCRKHCSTCLVQQVANNTPLLFSGVLQLFLSFVLFLCLNRTHCNQWLVQTRGGRGYQTLRYSRQFSGSRPPL